MPDLPPTLDEAAELPGSQVASGNVAAPEAVPAEPDGLDEARLRRQARSQAQPGIVLPDVPPRVRRNNRRRARAQALVPVGQIKRWTRRLLASAGLLLFAGCLFSLLDGINLPSWHLPDKAPVAAGGAVAVVIDPGHGGWDTGAVAQGVREKDLNLDVGLRVSRVLEGRGIRTKLTRDDDRFIPLSGRAEIANSLPGAIFVSIHFNDAPGEGRGANSRANGIETFYSEAKEATPVGAWTLASLLSGKTSAPPQVVQPVDTAQAVREGHDLADSIQASLISGTTATDRGIKERGLYVTRRVQGPAVLVEGGFVSHPAEAKLLGDPNYRQRLAESISDGIVKYLAATHRPAVDSPLAAARSGP